MNILKRNFSQAVSLILITATSAFAQDWPQWRGPDRDGKAPGFAAPKTWPQQLNVKWKVNVGSADATPALVGGKLYVFARQGDYEVIQCLDAANGMTLWTNRYEALPATGPAGSHPGPRSSPAVADGKVVTFGVRGTLSCLDADSGKLLWRKDDIHGWPSFFTAMSPLIADNLCIAEMGGKTNGTIAAYDLSSGAEKWTWSGDGASYVSPMLMTVGGAKLIITETDKRVIALTLADGKLVWDTPYIGKGMGAGNYDTPIIDGQTIIYAGVGRGMTAVKLDKDGDKFAGTALWSNLDNSPRFCTPVLKDGLLYCLSDPGKFFCIDAKTGKTVWTEANGSRGGFGSIVDAGQVLVALTPKSSLIVFQPGEKEFTEVATIKVADSATYAQPLLSGNRLFVEDANSVALLTLD